MEQKIAKYKKIYKIALTLTLVGFIDLIIVPILLKNMSIDFPQDTGLIPVLLGLLLGNIGIHIGFLITLPWFIWGIIAYEFNKKIKNLEKNNL